MQVPFAGMLADTQLLCVIWNAPSRLMFAMDNEPTVRADVPVFVIVTVWGGLVTPVASGGNATLAGEKVTNGPETPVPAKDTGCGLSPAESVKLSAP